MHTDTPPNENDPWPDFGAPKHSSGEGARSIPIEQIVAAPDNQPRKKLDRGLVGRIAETLREKGPSDLNPVLTVRTDEGFELFDGFHRYAAAIEAGMDSMPARVAGSREKAWTLAPTLNAQGVQWTRKDALRHAEQGIRDGLFRTRWGVTPIAHIAERYAMHGVNRWSLARHLRRVAESDPVIAEFVTRAQQQSTRRDGQAPAGTVWDIRAKATEKRLTAARRHVEQAAHLLRAAPPEVHRELWEHLGRTLKQAAAEHAAAKAPRPAETFDF